MLEKVEGAAGDPMGGVTFQPWPQRVLATVLAVLGLIALASQPVRAQQADGVIGWTYSDPNVGFPTAEAACLAQWNQWMNNGYSRFIGAVPGDKPTTRTCAWTHRGYLCPEETGGGMACGTILPGTVTFRCATGYYAIGPGFCAPSANPVGERPCDCDDQPNDGNLPAPVRGDPVVLKTGAVVEAAVDFATDDGRFVLRRRYRSKAALGGTFIQDFITNLGGRWSYDFAPELQIAATGGTPATPNAGVAFLTPDGAPYDFKLQSNGTWRQTAVSGVPDIDTRLKVEFLGTLPASLSTLRAASTQWRVTDANDTVWTMQTFARPAAGTAAPVYSIGRPVSRVERDGYRWDYAYAADGTLTTITDSYGRSASFEWLKVPVTTLPTLPGNAQPVPIALKEVVLPDQTRLRFTYDPPGGVPTGLYQARNLIKVERLDVSLAVVDSTTYLYEDARYRPFVTGVVNHRGERTASFTFGPLYGQALIAEGPGGADRHTFSYAWSGASMVTTVTGPLGKIDVYTFTKAAQYDFRLTRVEGIASASTPATVTTFTTAGTAATLTSATDALLRQTSYLYDTQRRPVSVTEAAGTAAARTTTVGYDPALNLPATVTRPGLTEVRTFSGGKLAVLTLTDTTSIAAPYPTGGRSRSWTYDWSPSGQLLAVDGPLPGNADRVSMTYDAAGQLLTQTNALGHVTQVTARNALGKPLTVRDPNGVDTDFTYDALGRLLSVTRDPGPGQSRYVMAYDAAGNLTRLTLPTGGWLNYTYDGADRVTRIDNDSGESLQVTLNAAGLPTAETAHAPGGAISRQSARAYDELGRLITATGAGGQTWQFAYDKLGNLTATTDALGAVSSASFDPFDRPITLTNPEQQTQVLGYTAFDAGLTGFTDGRWLTTGMVVDGFGETVQEVSPDRGLTRYWYDAVGRLTQQVAADGASTTYAYDAAHRLLSEETTAPGLPGQTIAYSYDSVQGGNRGVGRLTGVSDPSGSEALVYDAQGRVISRTKQIGARSYTFSYVWTASGDLASVTYPSGHMVKYVRAPDGRITMVRALAAAGGASTTLASGVSYRPFGPLAGLVQGNGLTLSRSHDGNDWLTGITLSGPAGTLLGLTLTRDGNGRVTGVADSATPLRGANYSYTAAGRLESASGAWGADSYSWDANDNRVRAERTVQGVTASDVATLAPGSNRLAEIRDGAGQLSRSFAHNNVGDAVSVTRAGAPTIGYAYDARGRLNGVTSGGTTIASYAYDWREARVAASSAQGGARHYLYAEDGRLLAEHDAASGALIREVVWLDDLPLAVVSGTVAAPIYSWITSGHLDEPLLLTGASGAVLSSVTRDPWGNPVLLAGPAGGADPLNLGYPGQWQDPATGLYQNWHRDYDPTLGRYIEADPLGLGGGSNLYAYARGDPVNAVDPEGRFAPLVIAFLAGFDAHLIYQRYWLGRKPRKWGQGYCDGDDINFDEAIEVGMYTMPLYSQLRGLLGTAEMAWRMRKAPSSYSAFTPIKPGSAGGPTAGKPFPKRVKDSIRADDPTETCVFCRRPGEGSQVDHAIPRSKGGQFNFRKCSACLSPLQRLEGRSRLSSQPPARLPRPMAASNSQIGN